MKSSDPVMDALDAVLEAENPPADGPIVAFDPEPFPPLPQPWTERIVAVASWKPTRDRLDAAGWRCATTPPANAAAAIVRLGRSRERGLATIAAALDATRAGAAVIVAGANAHGAASTQRRVAALLGPPRQASRRHARAARFVRPATLPPALEAWREFGRLRPILAGNAVSAPGLFAWDRVDAGTALLLDVLPPAITGRVADCGAGWGALSRSLLARHAAITRLDAYDADALAIAALHQNLGDPRAEACWHDVAAGLPRNDYDWVIANPPFHDDRGTDVGAGIAFIAAAANALAAGGRLALVANRRLPYEAILKQRCARVEKLAERDGFKALLATR